ncbi:conserved hypothetical protein [Ricinus communis]|uniref:Uncharacterized protein n=1 Tax=Ricinus communis TaxID=3988 RepID=B9RQK8_RICCO|nr:conserved hypothetical protein [Ricinus communis]
MRLCMWKGLAKAPREDSQFVKLHIGLEPTHPMTSSVSICWRQCDLAMNGEASEV